MQIDGNEIVVSGGFVKIAYFKEEWWDVDVEDPEDILRKLKDIGINADIFTFVQRLPESKPKYRYYMEWDNVAAIPVTTYDYWYKNQLHQNPRNKLRIAMKKGVVLKISDFNEELIQGITDIYNETPIRQGKPFPYYGVTTDFTRKGHITFLDRAIFICAYLDDKLIGFLKLVNSDKRLMRTMGILALDSHRDKAPMNLLISKAVEICAEKNIPYFIYGKYVYDKRGSDTLQDFKRYLGFESIALPRYFIPLNIWGKFIISFNLHNGIVGLMPKKLIKILLQLRTKWYEKRHDKLIEK
jgi:hypothetical protein